MAFEEIPLVRPVERSPIDEPPAPPSRWRWVAVALAGVAAGGALAFWWMSRSLPETATPAPTIATDVAVGSNRPQRQAMDLPSLDTSDHFLAGLVAALSQNPTLARLIATPGLVRATTLAVIQIGQGRTPADPLKVLRPASRLSILGTSSGRVDPKSYARWDPIVAALTSVSPTDAAQLYVNVKPLFDQAYIELGHPGGDFDTAIVQAIGMLDDVPAQPENPLLLRRTNYLEHEDATLRALPAVQKQFLLIGPDNRRRVMEWLRQVAGTLELNKTK
jgi:hypothetical protein